MAEEEKKVEEPVEEDTLEVELDSGEDQTEQAGKEAYGNVEMEEEAPKEDAKKEELNEYSKGVQARINELTSRMREEERQKNEAIAFAESVKKKNDELRTKVDELDGHFVDEFGSRVETAMDAAKQAYAKAHEEGDADALAAATLRISELSLDQAKHTEAKKRSEKRQAEPTEEVPAFQPEVKEAVQQPDPRAEAWAKENEWFGQDEAMTFAAYGLHKRLTDGMGLDPSTEEYYTALDKNLREYFPAHFEQEEKSKAAPRVVPAGASASKSGKKQGRRTVKLNASQLAIAKKLGVTPEQYAAHVKE